MGHENDGKKGDDNCMRKGYGGERSMMGEVSSEREGK